MSASLQGRKDRFELLPTIEKAGLYGARWALNHASNLLDGIPFQVVKADNQALFGAHAIKGLFNIAP